MSELEEMLEPHDFFLCYQSVLVSLRHITGVIDVGKGLYELSLKGTAVKVPLSRNRHDELLRRLREMG